MPTSKELETELFFWRKTLANKPVFARNVIFQVKSTLRGTLQAKSDPNYINRSISNLIAGTATPQDFGYNY